MRAWRLPVLTGALVLFPATLAHAEYRGTDLWGNIAPSDGEVGLADRYPLSYYGLDFHVDGPSASFTGGFDTGDIPALIAQFIASLLFQITTWLMKVVLDVFDWAFSIDLVNGPDGALIPIGSATQDLYTNVLSPFMGAVIILLGGWAAYKGIIQRRVPDAMSGIAMSMAMVVIALVLIWKPEATLGTVSQLTNATSVALLSGGTGDGTQARVRVEDHLFKTFVYNPWVALEFGGLSHCVGAQTDPDGYPKPVAPNSPDRVTCRDHVKSIGGFGGYAPRFLQHPPGSDERDDMYEALKSGKENPTWPGWRINRADAPGVDIQQAGGAFQRLALAVLIFAGALGAVLLLGMLSFAALIAQVIWLALLAFAPAALLLGLVPDWGHKLFRGWLRTLMIVLVIKAVYALLLSILVNVSLAMEAASGTLPYLIAFGLPAAFYWMVFLKRKPLAKIMLRDRETTTKLERTTREAIATPVATAAGVGWAGGVAAARAARGRGQEEGEVAEQEHVNRPGRQAPAPAPAEEVVAATPSTTRARKTQPPQPPVETEVAERVPARAPEPARGAREDLVVALDAASEPRPAEGPAPSPTGSEQRPPQRPMAEVIGPAKPAPQERAERPAGMGHLARPEGEQPERIRTPPEDA